MNKRHTLDELELAFASCPAALAAGANAPPGKVIQFPKGAGALQGGPPAAFAAVAASAPDMNAAAKQGTSILDGKTPDQQRDMIEGMLNNKWAREIADRPGRTRETVNGVAHPSWLDIMFGLAHAAHTGVPGMKALAQEWSKTSDRFDQAAFERDWDSADPTRPGGITIGTLIKGYIDAGHDVGALPHMSGSGSNAATGGATALTTVGKRLTWADIPFEMAASAAMTLLNQVIGFARCLGGGPSYFVRRPDGSIMPITKESLIAMLAPYKVLVPEGNTTKQVRAADFWISSPQRYTVDDVAYDPEGRRALTGEKIENTWRGFAVDPIQGTWRRFRRHLLRVICSGDKSLWKYMLRWLAHAVQFPGTPPEIMVVLRSNNEGAGKSTVGYAMKKIFGRHGYTANSLEELFGDFNDAIIGKTFIMSEESAFPRDHKLSNIIKACITADELSINTKGRPRYSIPNMLHILVCANNREVIAAGANARRFFMLDVTAENDAAYFDALYQEINNGGAEAFLYALLKMDLTQFHPRRIPVTQALITQQRQNGDTLTGWLTDAVYEGEIVPGHPDGGFGHTHTFAVLYALYREWVKNQGIKRPLSGIAFGREMRGLGFTAAKGPNNVSAWAVPDRLIVLKAADKRAGIRKITP